MESSIIIRTHNEETWVGIMLARLASQSYQNFEIIIVDSGSTDRTLEIIKKFPVRLIQIPAEDFTYPYALNVGCRAAKAEKYFVFLSAHSLPISDSWLEDGLSNFVDNKIFGVYGMTQALPNGTFWEKLLFSKHKVSRARLSGFKKQVSGAGIGVMGFTNAAIRREFWDQKNFDENYELGGEDQVWSDMWFKKGFVAILDSAFSVAHSHGLGLRGLWKQYRYWKSVVARPQKFRKLKFRGR